MRVADWHVKQKGNRGRDWREVKEPATELGWWFANSLLGAAPGVGGLLLSYYYCYCYHYSCASYYYLLIGWAPTH